MILILISMYAGLGFFGIIDRVPAKQCPWTNYLNINFCSQILTSALLIIHVARVAYATTRLVVTSAYANSGTDLLVRDASAYFLPLQYGES